MTNLTVLPAAPMHVMLEGMIFPTAEKPTLLPFPFSQDPLDPGIRSLLIPIAMFGTFSLFTTFWFVSWITFRLFSRRGNDSSWVGYNQYIVLIYNLLIADLCQGLAFFLNWYWYGENRIVAPHRACFAQGWILSLGDVASGFFVLTIAFHTYVNIVQGKRMAYPIFVAMIVSLWGLSLMLSITGPAIHGNRFFVDSGVWCWVSMEFGPERLYLHYLWIFIDEFGTVAIYTAIYYFLQKRLRTMRDARTNTRVEAASRSMILYPTFYVLLTLPLASGRMASLSGIDVPPTYLAVAACAMTSCGWLDCLVYTLTRRSLIATQLRPRRTLAMNPALGLWKHYAGRNDLDATFTTEISAGKELRDPDLEELRDLEYPRKTIAPERPQRSNRWMGGWERRSELKPANLMGCTSPTFGIRSLPPSARNSPVLKSSPDAPPNLGGITSKTKVEITVTHATPANGSLDNSEAISWFKM